MMWIATVNESGNFVKMFHVKTMLGKEKQYMSDHIVVLM